MERENRRHALLLRQEVMEEDRTIYTSEKGYISLECKREERAETRGEESVGMTERRSDEEQ